MKEDAVTHQHYVTPPLGYRLFKYTVYVLLAVDVLVFLRQDMQAAQALFADGVTWRNAMDALTAAIDTFAWLVLLLLFELETAVISDEKLQGGLKWVLLAVRTLAYVAIVRMAWGYFLDFQMISDIEPFLIANVCDLAGTTFTYVVDLDEYLPIDAVACAALQGQDLLRVAGTDIIGTAEALRAAAHLTIVDVVNATDWLIIVVLLEAEVLLQLRDRLTEPLIFFFKLLKVPLYGTLFVAAVYWFFYGDFIDWWDALLWLIAFIFIELNIFQWHAETEEEKAHRSAGSSHA